MTTVALFGGKNFNQIQ